MSRADMTHDLTETQLGDLPETPVHSPVLRPDSRRSDIPLKTPRVQVDLSRRIREQAWMRTPSHWVQPEPPASMDDASTVGHRVVVAICLLALAGWGVSRWFGWPA